MLQQSVDIQGARVVPLTVDNHANQQPLVPMVEWNKGVPIKDRVIYSPNIAFYGDIHGDPNFRPDGSRLGIALGDAVDYGPESYKRIREMMQWVGEGKMIYEVGNHDVLIKAVMTPDGKPGAHRDRQALLVWMANGGYLTAQGAGVNFGALEQTIDSMAARMNLNPKDPLVRQGMVKMYFSECYNEPDPNDPPANIARYQRKLQELDGFLPTIRSNQNMKEIDAFYQQQGLYIAADGGYGGHSLPPADSNGNLLDMGSYGKGVDGMDALNAAWQRGDPEAIFFLAGGGEASPVWSRDIIAVLQNPTAFHNYREQMNAQAQVANAQRPAFEIQQFFYGHTTEEDIRNAGQSNVNRTQMLGGGAWGIDYGAGKGGGVARANIDMTADGNVSARLVDSQGNPILFSNNKPGVESWKINGKQVLVTEPPKPVDLAQAEDAKKQLDKLAQEGKIPQLGWPQIRVLNVESILADEDPAKNIPQGALRKAGWSNDEPTRKFLENLINHAQNLSEETLQRVQQDLQINPNRLITMTPQELQAAADRLQQVLHANDGAQALQMIEASRDLLIDRNAAVKAQAEAAANAQTANAQTAQTAESAINGQIHPDEALALISGEALRAVALQEFTRELQNLDRIRDQIGEPLYQRARKQLVNNINEFQMDRAQRDARIQQLIESGKITQEQANSLQLDLEIAGYKYERSHYEENSPQYKALTTRIDKMSEQREAMVDAKGQPIQSALDTIVNTLAPGVSAEDVQINPLGILHNVVSQAVLSPQNMDEFIGHVTTDLHVSEPTAKIIREMLENANKTVITTDSKQEKKINMVATFSMITLLLLLAQFWTADAKKKQYEGGG